MKKLCWIIVFTILTSGLVYAEDDFEFIDKEFEETIRISGDYFLETKEQETEDWFNKSLKYDDFLNLQFLLIDEEIYPKSYEDIYMFPNITRFASWDDRTTLEQYLEIDRYVKSLNPKAEVEFQFDFASDKTFQIPVFQNDLANEIFMNARTTSAIGDPNIGDIILKGLIVDKVWIGDASEDEIVLAIKELMRYPYINVIDFSALDIDESLFYDENWIVKQKIIRKPFKYEVNVPTEKDYSPDAWYAKALDEALESDYYSFGYRNNKVYARADRQLYNSEVIKMLALALDKPIDYDTFKFYSYRHTTDDMIWYTKYYKSMAIDTDKYPPNQKITRYELARLLDDVLLLEGVDELPSDQMFSDWYQMLEEDKVLVHRLLNLNITSGVGDGNRIYYRGDVYVTAGMMACCIENILEYIE